MPSQDRWVLEKAGSLGINIFYAHRFIGYGLLAQFNAMKRILAASLLMASVVWWGGQILNMPAFATLLLQASLGGIVFVARVWLLRDPIFQDGLLWRKTRFAGEKR